MALGLVFIGTCPACRADLFLSGDLRVVWLSYVLDQHP
jgi:hypothetical protein